MKNKKGLVTFMTVLVCMFGMSICCYAAGEDLSTITAPIDRVYDFICAIVSAAGGIMLIFGIISLVSNWQSHDTTQQVAGIMKCAASIVIAVAPWVVQYILG